LAETSFSDDEEKKTRAKAMRGGQMGMENLRQKGSHAGKGADISM